MKMDSLILLETTNNKTKIIVRDDSDVQSFYLENVRGTPVHYPNKIVVETFVKEICLIYENKEICIMVFTRLMEIIAPGNTSNTILNTF